MTRRWWPAGLLVICCVLLGGPEARPLEAAVLLQYGTNVARVVAIELNYAPEVPLLQVAATVDGRYVKRAEYRRDAAIQAVLDVMRFKDRGRLSVVYEDNRILSFFVSE